MSRRTPPPNDARGQQLETLYTQLAQSAARLMVVHEASNLLRSTHDPAELSQGLLAGIADAVLAASGCVAGLEGDELRILATRGIEEHEADALAADSREAAVWFAVADGDEPRSREEMQALLVQQGLGTPRDADADDEWEPPAEDGEEEEPDAEDEERGREEEETDWEGAEPDRDEDETPTDEGQAAAAEEGLDHPRDELSADQDDDEDPTSYEKLWDEAEASDEESFEPLDEETDEDTGAGILSAAPAFQLYLPLRVAEEVLGVLALGRRVDGRPYRQEDIQLARSLSSHLALALNHAALFAERSQRIEQLSSLLQISREITSSLDLDRVLGTIAHMLGMILPNRRTVVALVTERSASIRASSDPNFQVKEARRDPLLPLLEWAREARQVINTCHESLEADPDAEGRDLLLPWLSAEGGPRGLAILPLEDDQGVLGLLVIETDPDAPPLDDAYEELVTILANQTTVAIRNAELYQQVPMIGVLEPLLGKARRMRLGGKRRLLTRLAVVAAVVAVGFFVPLPAWVGGDASLRPAAPVALRAATSGTVEEVLVEEGQRITAGTVAARMRRDELAVELDQARAEVQRVRAEAARARSQNDLSTYRARQAKLAELLEVERFLLAELERTALIAPVDGIVLTPDIELRRGEYLERGATLLELADLSSMEVEVRIADHDVPSIAPGRSARLKLHAYPERTFRGEIVRLAPRADRDGTFRVTVWLPNDDGALRPGMTGHARLEIPARPVLTGFLAPLFRRLRLGLWL